MVSYNLKISSVWVSINTDDTTIISKGGEISDYYEKVNNSTFYTYVIKSLNNFH